jgi:8-oxo-dGTP pyrophosphatase MutT (NUDIX family)
VKLRRAADAVLIRPALNGPQTLLGRRADNGLLCWPGGTVEPPEGSMDAAWRELREETGYRTRYGPDGCLWSGPGLSAPEWSVSVYLWHEGWLRSRLRRLRPQPGEMTWVGWVPVVDLVEVSLTPSHQPILRLVRKALHIPAEGE